MVERLDGASGKLSVTPEAQAIGQFEDYILMAQREAAQTAPQIGHVALNGEAVPSTAAETEAVMHETEQPSGWTRFWGGLKLVGGVLETAAGGALTAVGVATSEVGIGIPITAGGLAITTHGVDTTVSGARTLWEGRDVDTLTSQGLQAAGLNRTTANLADAGISIVGSFGSGAILRSGRIVSTLDDLASTPQHFVRVAFKPAKPLGHNIVGVTADGSTKWAHLVIGGDAQLVNGFPISGTGVVQQLSRLPPGYKVVEVPVSAARGEAALQRLGTTIGQQAPYRLFCNDCTTFASTIIREGGIFTLPVSTPGLTYATSMLQSPLKLQSLGSATVPWAFTGGFVNMAIGAEAGIDR